MPLSSIANRDPLYQTLGLVGPVARGRSADFSGGGGARTVASAVPGLLHRIFEHHAQDRGGCTDTSDVRTNPLRTTSERECVREGAHPWTKERGGGL